VKKQSTTREIRVRIDSRYEFIDLVQQLADRLCRAAGLGRGAVLNVGLAVREAVANAIKHGNRQEAGKWVEIVFRLDPGRIVIAVRDQGTGFDPAKQRDPLEPENVFRTNGRGIFFIRSFVDDVTFTRRKGGGTEVRMEKRVMSRRSGRAAPRRVAMRQGGEVR
jgi:serine/threonine-protein kinase RsbW